MREILYQFWRFAPWLSALLATMLLSSVPATHAEEPVGKDSWRELAAQQQQLEKELHRLFEAQELDEAVSVVERLVAVSRRVIATPSPNDEQAKVVRRAQGWLGQALPWLATRYRDRRDWPGAIRWQREFVDVQAQMHGRDSYLVGDARRELEYVEQLSKLPPKDARQLLMADQQAEKGWELSEKGDVRPALPLAEDALRTHQRLLGERNLRTANDLDLLSTSQDGQGNFAQAASLCRQALEIRKEVLGENHPEYAKNLMTLAMSYHRQGDYEGAEPLFQKALKIQKKVLGKNNRDYAYTLGSLAILHKDQRDYARAVPLMKEALEIQERVLGENDRDYAVCLGQLAVLYELQGDYARAEPLFRKTAELVKRTRGENDFTYAITLHDLACLYCDHGDYAQAERRFREACEIWKRNGGEHSAWYASGLSHLASVYIAQKDYASAVPLCQKALDLEKEVLGLNHPWYAEGLSSLAGLYRDQGNYKGAEPLYRNVLDIRKTVLGENHPDYARSLNDLAVLYYTQGDYVQAEPPLRRAVGIIRRQLDATAAVQSERQQLAMLQSERFYLDNYLTLIARSGRDAGPVFREALAWKGIVLRRQRQARAAGETPELLTIFAQLQRVATQLSRQAWATPDPQQKAGWRERVDKLSAEKDRLEAELSRMSTAYGQAKCPVTLEDVQAALPQDSVLVDFLEYLHYTPVDRKAGAKESWEPRLVAFVMSHDRPVEMVPLGAVGPLSEAIDTWRTTFGMSPQGAAAGRLLRQRVWEPLEAKLASAKIVLASPDGTLGRLPLGALPGKEPGKYLLQERKIALVPVPQLIPEIVHEQGRKQLQKKLLLLGNVDYGAASDKPGPPTSGPRTSGEANEGARAVGSDALPLFPALPATKTEITAIGKLYTQGFGPEGVTILEEKQATKQAFRVEAARHLYLHVATHGFFAPANQRSALAAQPREASRFGAPQHTAEAGGLHPGLLSGLVLAGANRAGKQHGLEALNVDDGIATAEEIGTLNLEGVELVMLSACETGLGETAGGEGLVGLQRAFQTASARTVVASLWEVDDKATRTLMIEFYKNLWEKKLGKLEALRQAQLAMLREYAPKEGMLRGPSGFSPVPPDALAKAHEPLSPFYWAAFVLSGDWR
ncbi:MAG: tetratricopeptide repeat protein [Thermoguttaceae bacterium]